MIQIEHENKKVFTSQNLSKEGSKAYESSFRVLYYGDASSSIPFMWESRPGTPKHTLSLSSLPPLTPPPSYHLTTQNSKSLHKNSKSHFLLSTMFPRMGSRKTHILPSLSSPSVSSSCSSSLSYSYPLMRKRRGIHERSRSEVEFEVENGGGASSLTSTLCFGGRDIGSWRMFRGRDRMKNAKKALLSIVGHGRA